MSKILITGGTGYIGSHIAVELLNNNYEVLIVDNFSNSKISSLDGVEKITGKRPVFAEIDLTETKPILEFTKENPGISAIIHLAAFKANGESVEKPIKYYHNNLVSLLNVKNAMLKNNIPHIIYSSSACIYGDPDKLPVTEATRIASADSPYGNTKKISEEIIKDTVKSNDLIKSIILRYFNVIGAHDSALIGELPQGVPNNLVPIITQAVAGVLKELKIYGNDYDTPDGHGVRDYIDVTDIARAHVKALERLLNKENTEDYEVYNLGTGRGYSVKEMIDTFESVTGEKINKKLYGRRPGDIAEIYTDSSLAEKILGWQAKRSLEESLKSAWEWEKKYRKLSN